MFRFSSEQTKIKNWERATGQERRKKPKGGFILDWFGIRIANYGLWAGTKWALVGLCFAVCSSENVLRCNLTRS